MTAITRTPERAPALLRTEQRWLASVGESLSLATPPGTRRVCSDIPGPSCAGSRATQLITHAAAAGVFATFLRELHRPAIFDADAHADDATSPAIAVGPSCGPSASSGSGAPAWLGLPGGKPTLEPAGRAH